MMTLRPDQEQVLEQIKNLAEGRYDLYASPDEFSVREYAVNEEQTKLQYRVKQKEIEFMESALGQLLAKVRIPAPFYRRCPDWLKVQNLTHFNSKHKNDYLFRMEPTNEVRAALSDSYGIIDDEDLFPILFESLASREDVALRKFQQDSHITQLVVDFTDAVGTHNGTEYCAGLLVTNSETGHSAVWIEPVVHIPTCSFVARNVLKRQGIDCRIIHRGNFPRERVAPLVEQAKEAAQVGIVQLAEAFTVPMPTDRVLNFARNVDNFPSRFVQILEEEWADQERVIKAEAARRIILLAQDLPLFQRIQVEQKAGDLIGLFSSYKSRFADIMKEIEDV